MKSRLILAAVGAALLLTAADARQGYGTDAENTGKNVRDKDGDTLTVFDQGNSEQDLQITANVRKAIVDDDGLSTNAHNVKVITNGGTVTLRGPVENAKEKTVIEAKAKSVAGVQRVNNQLEVDTD
jgi:hyperosmotically inducible protein